MKKKMFYNKLVRDKIPQIIEEDGKKCIYSRVEGATLENYAKRKLLEEVEEFLANPPPDRDWETFSFLHSIHVQHLIPYESGSSDNASQAKEIAHILTDNIIEALVKSYFDKIESL